MPSRNKVPNAAELVSRSLNCTSGVSPCERSDIVDASRNCLPPPVRTQRIMMNKSLRARGRESSRKSYYGFQRVGGDASAVSQKKEPPFPAAFEVDNREASNRVDRSHSVSKRGQPQS